MIFGKLFKKCLRSDLNTIKECLNRRWSGSLAGNLRIGVKN
jgi:hypothetical protein